MKINEEWRKKALIDFQEAPSEAKFVEYDTSKMGYENDEVASLKFDCLVIEGDKPNETEHTVKGSNF